MAKKPQGNKKAAAPENKAQQPEMLEQPEAQQPEMLEQPEAMVRVRVRPGRGIGGFGGPGHVGPMPLSLAQQYEADGYVDILNEEE